MDILFLGDSLVEYFDWQEAFPVHRVVNLGVSGESVEGLLSRIRQITRKHTTADIVFIMTGINNVAMDDVAFLDSYRTIIEQLSAAYPQAQIFIHSLLPTLADFMPALSINHVNQSLKELAQRTGVSYLDIHRFFIGPDSVPIKTYFVDDGIHLSGKGYAVWFKVLETILNQQ
jgi:lysophospholipase L1-like esterase